MKLSRAFVWTAATSTATVAALHLALSPPVAFEASAAEPRAGEIAPAASAQPASLAPRVKPSSDARPLAPADTHAIVRTSAARDEDETTLYTFDLLVLDADDLPLPGAAVYLAPADEQLNAIGWTDARGHVRVQWRSPRESLRIAYGCEHPAHGASNVKLAELTRTPYSAAIELRTTAEPRLPASDELVDGFAPRTNVVLPALEHEPLSPWRVARTVQARFDAAGLLHFAAPLENVPGEKLAAPAGWTLPPPAPVPSHTPAAGEDVTWVRGTVTDSRSAAQPLARVRATVAESGFSVSTRTRTDGSFGLGPLPARGARVAFGGGDLGRAAVELGRSDERVQVLRPALQRGRELVVRLSDREGRALAGWKAELASPGTSASASPAWADTAWTDDEGKLRVPNVPAHMLRLDVFAPGADDVLPAASVHALWAGPESEIALDTRVDERAALALRVIDAAGRPVEDAEVRLTAADGDRAALLAFDPVRRAFHAHALPAGKYRLALHRAGEHTFVWPGTLALDDRSELELGALAFERRGRLVVEPSSGAVIAYDLARVSDAGEMWVASFRARGRWLLELPAGRYVLSAAADAVRKTSTFEIAAGRMRALGLDVR